MRSNPSDRLSPHMEPDMPFASKIRSLFPIAAALLLSVSAATAHAQSCTNLCLKQVSCPSGGTTSLSGIVYTPNGVDPLPNVVVYVPNATVAAFTPGVQCVTSAQPVSGSPLVGTTTAQDGSFKLTNMPVGTSIPVVIQAGRWRRQYTVNTTACANTALNMQFPSTHSQGDIPLIAVASGSVDAAECVLRKAGIADTEFTVPTAYGGTGRVQLYFGSSQPGIIRDYNGISLPSESVLVGTSGSSVLSNYDIVMFPCQGTPSNQVSSTNEANLLAYANAGGRIYATHWSEVWLDNSSFAGTVNWNNGLANAGSSGDVTLTAGNSNTNNATVVTSGFTDGTTMANWLQSIGATTTYGQIYVDSPHSDLTSVISPTQTWLTYSGTETAYKGSPLQLTFDTPIGATSANQCGRVMYNDYHVESPASGTTFPGECNSGSMTAQEKLLEYGLFDLSTFITPQGTPTATINLSASPTSYTAGDSADTLNVLVTNTSTSTPSNPSLTVALTLPTGMTATSMQDSSGGGWLCTASTLTCTRITGMDANSSDNIALTISVPSGTLPGNVTFGATLSGGGLAANVTASLTMFVYGKAVISWNPASPITYPAPLTTAQLNATAVPTAGAWAYSPAFGAVLNAGTQTLSTTFTPTDTVGYPNPATATASIVVNQATQTISFAPLATPIIFNTNPVTLSATGGASGNPVVFTVTGPATVSGNTLTYIGPGTVVVTANQAGNINYSAAAPVSQTIIVQPNTQTITFTLASPVTYGVAPIPLSATGGPSGNPVTFTVTSGPATLSGNTLTITGAGTVVVTANQAGNAAYQAATPVAQTLIVNQASQVISFSLASPVTYGVAPITLSATATSGLAVSFAVTSGPATISGNTLTITGGGIVVVTATQAGNANYSAATPDAQTLVVNPAAQTITFAQPTSPVTYGVAPITLSATTTSGLAVTFTVKSGLATVSGNTLTITGAGAVVIAADQLGNASYSAASEVTRTIQVNKAASTTTFSATPTTLFVQNPLTLTATVAPGNGLTVSPTGTVTFLVNGNSWATAPVVNGVATYTGGYNDAQNINISAVYNGDNGFNSSASNSVPVSLLDFTLTAGSGFTPQTVVHGSTVTYTFSVAPVNGSAWPTQINFALDGYPYGSSIFWSTSNLAAGSGAATVTLNLQTATFPSGAVARNQGRATALLAGLTLGCLLVPFGWRMRRRPVRLLAAIILLAASAGALTSVTGCATGWDHENFTLVISAVSGQDGHYLTTPNLRVQ